MKTALTKENWFEIQGLIRSFSKKHWYDDDFNSDALIYIVKKINAEYQRRGRRQLLKKLALKKLNSFYAGYCRNRRGENVSLYPPDQLDYVIYGQVS